MSTSATTSTAVNADAAAANADAATAAVASCAVVVSAAPTCSLAFLTAACKQSLVQYLLQITMNYLLP